jgi:hypothetical protein
MANSMTGDDIPHGDTGIFELTDFEDTRFGKPALVEKGGEAELALGRLNGSYFVNRDLMCRMTWAKPSTEMTPLSNCSHRTLASILGGSIAIGSTAFVDVLSGFSRRKRSNQTYCGRNRWLAKSLIEPILKGAHKLHPPFSYAKPSVRIKPSGHATPRPMETLTGQTGRALT